MSPEIVTIDGLTFPGIFKGYSEPLEVELPGAPPVRFRPWRFTDYIAALRDCVAVEESGMRLDVEELCARVLRVSDVPASLHSALTPIALWWAAGGVEPEADRTKFDQEWIDLSSRWVRLRPWSEADQLAALLAARGEDASRAPVFDAVAYLLAMVKASVIALDPPCDLAELDARETSLLLQTVAALNVPDAGSEPALLADTRYAAQQTLRLCRVLGWTPSQVWSAPAAEIERLLQLLSHAATPGLGPARRRIADLPDAVVVRFDGNAE